MNLHDLFSVWIFRVPDYQRGYAWGEKQLAELWDDLEDIPKDNGGYRKHYTGTIYLEECNPSENEQWLMSRRFSHVVDGQQRLMTLSILIFELLKLAPEGHGGESRDDLLKTYLCQTNASGNSKVYKFRYEATDRNHDFLLHAIYEDPSAIVQDGSLNVYRKNLTTAKEFFANRLKDLSHSQREVLFCKLTTALDLDVRQIKEPFDVQEVFETLNNRGKQLSVLERLKNRLIYLTVKLPSSAST